MKKILTLLFLIPVITIAQKQGNIWYFADSCGLDFSSGSPVSLTDGNVAEIFHSGDNIEGTATISDSAEFTFMPQQRKESGTEIISLCPKAVI